MAPPPGVTGWVVQIPMPRWGYRDSVPSKLFGKPVGWLTTNNMAGTRAGKIRQGKIAAKWRKAAAVAYEEHHVPQDLGRIQVTFQYAQTKAGRLSDSPNLELTVKRIIDALQPASTCLVAKKIRGSRTGATVNVEQEIPGWGVVPNDTDRWVVRGSQQEWLPRLPNTAGGIVVVTIIPLAGITLQ